MTSTPDLTKLKLETFCRDGQAIERALGFAQLPRLAESVVSADASTRFELRVQGLQASLPGGLLQDELTLTVRGRVQLVCQRCLQPYAQPIEGHTRFVLVASDEAADAMVAEAGEDDELEPLVGGKPVDMLSLAEDELLLALPLVPRHEVCPEADSSVADAKARAAELPSPFAALAALKKPQDTE
jgi:uncharacterized protein